MYGEVRGEEDMVDMDYLVSYLRKSGWEHDCVECLRTVDMEEE